MSPPGRFVPKVRTRFTAPAFLSVVRGRRGRIDPAWVKEQIHDLPNTVFYACGPNPLVEFAEHLVVTEMSVPKAQMKTEKWG